VDLGVPVPCGSGGGGSLSPAPTDGAYSCYEAPATGPYEWITYSNFSVTGSLLGSIQFLAQAANQSSPCIPGGLMPESPQEIVYDVLVYGCTDHRGCPAPPSGTISTKYPW
jgi:hypothetical protein